MPRQLADLNKRPPPEACLPPAKPVGRPARFERQLAVRPSTPHTITLQPSSFRNLRLPKRLRVVYFLARTRLAQRLIMVPAALPPCILHFALEVAVAGDTSPAQTPGGKPVSGTGSPRSSGRGVRVTQDRNLQDVALRHEPATPPSQGSLAARGSQASGRAGWSAGGAGLAGGPRPFPGSRNGEEGPGPVGVSGADRGLGLLAVQAMGTVAGCWSQRRRGLGVGRSTVPLKGVSPFPGQETQALTMGRELGPSSGS